MFTKNTHIHKGLKALCIELVYIVFDEKYKSRPIFWFGDVPNPDILFW